MTNLENLEDNQETQITPESLTDEQVQQVSFTDESREWGRQYETPSEIDSNPTFKTWINKIVEKEAESIINSFEKSYEGSGWLPIEQWVRFIQNKHTDLIPFVCWDLWLPYKSDIYLHPEQWTKFSDLTFEQKMWFMCLKRTFDSYKGNIDNVSSEDFINKYYSIYTWTVEVISQNFNNRIKKDAIEVPTGFDFNTFRVDSAYYIKRSKFLKDNYWLTDEEISKFKDLKDVLEKHPEYKANPELMVQECGIKEVYGIAKIILALVVIGVLVRWFREVKNFFMLYFWLEETEPKKYGTVEMVDFERTFKILAATATYQTLDENNNPWSITYRENAIKFNENWGRLMRNIKKWIEKVVNKVEWKQEDISATVAVWYLFDARNAKCTVEKTKNWKGIFHVKIRRPECVAEITDVEVSRRRWERIKLEKFDNFETRALNDIKRQAIEKANTQSNLDQAEASLKECLLGIFQTTWYTWGGISIEGKNVQDVIIEYIDGGVQTPWNNTQSSWRQNRPSWNQNWWSWRQHRQSWNQSWSNNSYVAPRPKRW